MAELATKGVGGLVAWLRGLCELPPLYSTCKDRKME